MQVTRLVSAALLAGLVPVLGAALGWAVPVRGEFIWGIQGHPGKQVAYAASGAGLTEQLDYLQRLGVTHYRIDLYPDSLGRVDPAFRGMVAAAESRNISILPVLVAHPDTAASVPANYRRGHAIGSAFASRHRDQFSHIEAGNELEVGTLRFTVDSSVHPARISYFEGADLDNYVDHLLTRTTAFLRGMTDGIHSGSPGTRVIINAGWRHYGFFEALRRDGVNFDVYGYHWYSEMGDFAAEVLPHLPGNREIWVTEANRRNTSDSYSNPAEQAAWIGRVSRRLAAIPRVRALFIYELYDQPAVGATDPESHYGLVACSDETCSGPRRLKPGFHAYRDVIRELR